MNPLSRVIALLLLYLIPCCLYAQDARPAPDAGPIATGYLEAVSVKSGFISRAIDKQTEKYLSRLQRREARLYKKLAQKDTAAAAKALAASRQQYASLRQKLAGASQKIHARQTKYIPLLDTVATSLQFLRQYGNLFKQGLAASRQLNDALAQVNNLDGKLQQAEDVQAFIKDRRQQLTEQLQQAGMGDAMKSFNKEAYYYSAQLTEYRDALNDPDKAARKAIGLLNGLPAFRSFMQQNSLLASLFGAPGDNATSAAQALGGLQTRTSVQDLIQTQLAAAGPNASAMMQQNIQAAQSQLNALKDKINRPGGGSGDIDMPGFTPNQQRTKTFLQRLEYGANVQTQRTGSFFPATTDLALTAGYKLNDKSTLGIGASYRMGWGTGIQHIALSHQGIGFRSFADVKLKGSFWISGGTELNYRSAFRDFSVLNDFSPWQRSALMGLTKKYKAGKKLKGNIQLLYDFLWNQQAPAAQPLLFRVGYSL